MAARVRTRDGEILSLFLMTFLGLGVLLAVNIGYSDWPGMIDTWNHWAAVVGVTSILVIVGFVITVFIKWNDPNYDKYRHAFWVGCLLVIIYICGFKAANNESKSVTEDSNAAKQEQTK
jgi:hypothetical protein